jgi:hypothetical protein
MATKKPSDDKDPPKPKQPAPKKPTPVKTQMQGESGDDDLGYDPKIIKTEEIPD